MNLEKQDRPIMTFVALTFALTLPFYSLIIISGKVGGGGGLYAAGIMWCPGLSALLTCRLYRIPVRSLGWQWGQTRYQVASYLIPLLYTSIAYLLIWIIELGGFPSAEYVKSRAELIGLPIPIWAATILFILLNASFGFVWSCASAVGEEIGWRGFLAPRLAHRAGFTAASVLSGLLWAVWHYPVLLFADYNSGTPPAYALTCFTVLIVSTSFIYMWLRLRSGSLWTGVFLHASHNLFIQSIFTPLTAQTQRTPYAADEFGFMLPLVSIPFAIWFWNKRKALKKEATEAALPNS